MPSILVVDDQANIRKVLSVLLQRDGHRVTCAANGEAAMAELHAGSFDLLITDQRMPGIQGTDLLAHILRASDPIPVIIITAHGTVDQAVAALKMGAFDYVTKPFDKDELRLSVRRASQIHNKGQKQLHDAGDSAQRRAIVGNSSSMQGVLEILDRAADTPSTVLITGESGTGKELVAAALHSQSQRSCGPLIKVNCAAIPKELVESEFFGHSQGAFTGAIHAKPGRFELADGGTLFLDEIGDIPLETQVKLLRALQEGEFERVGGIQTQRVDVRVVAATHRNLPLEIAAGRFREDLYYRLNVVPIHLPPLRERIGDIPALAHTLLQRCNRRLSTCVTGFSDEAMETLKAYPWPGNIRELENAIERSILFADNNTIEKNNLPPHLFEKTAAPEHDATSKYPESIQCLPQDQSASFKDIVRDARHRVERDLICKALEATGGNITQAALKLDLSRKGLQNKIKDLGLHTREINKDAAAKPQIASLKSDSA